MKFIAIMPINGDPSTETTIIGPVKETPTHVLVEAWQKELALVSLSTGVKYQCIEAPDLLEAIIQAQGSFNKAHYCREPWTCNGSCRRDIACDH